MDFALALYRQLTQQPGNLCFSPFSIRVALAMAEAGARGETATQIRDALGSESSEALVAVLQKRQAHSRSLEIDVANALWSQTGAPLEAKFRDVIVDRYGGDVSSLDFRRDAEGARKTINRWVEARTRDKIRELLPPRSLDADSRLVLVNAIYFKDRWIQEFRAKSTRDAPFHREDGGMVQVPLMSQLADVPYFEANGYQVVELEYESGLSMLVLLPDRADGLRRLESELSAEFLERVIAQMEDRSVRIFLPRFEMRSSPADLVVALAALGITRAFSREADFSGINGLRPPNGEALLISSVFHQAFVAVNEAGTEASAATGLGFLAGSAMPAPTRPLEFRADHPFVFAIRERSTGEILFLGRVTDPSR